MNKRKNKEKKRLKRKQNVSVSICFLLVLIAVWYSKERSFRLVEKTNMNIHTHRNIFHIYNLINVVALFIHSSSKRKTNWMILSNSKTIAIKLKDKNMDFRWFQIWLEVNQKVEWILLI